MFKVNESIGFLVGTAGKQVSGRLMQLFAENNIDIGHSGWIVLTRLWEEEGISQQEISTRSGVAKPNISNYLDNLEKNNYVVRVNDRQDDRNKLIYLTQKGKDLKDVCQRLAIQANEELCEALSTEEVEQLRRLLFRLKR